MTALTITPKRSYYNYSVTLDVTCRDLIVPSSNTPSSMTLKLLASDSSGPTFSLTLPTTLLLTPSSLQTVSQTKQYATGGSRTSMAFTFTLPLAVSDSLLLYFSKVYPEGLGLKAIMCYD